MMTTNFDPLISRACSLLNRFPAVYDLAGLRETNSRIGFESSLVYGSAIYHLHGQHTGFLLLNTKEALLEQAKRIRPVLESQMRGKLIIVCGYSGDNDPLIDEIANLNPSEHGLFWIRHDYYNPAQNVCDLLLSRPNCYLIRNQPSDSFFISLANRISVGAPKIFSNPFVHMRNILDGVRPFSDAVNTLDNSLYQDAINMLDRAIHDEHRYRPERERICELSASGRYDDLLKVYAARKDLHPGDWRLVVRSAIAKGSELVNRANSRARPEAEKLYEEAILLFIWADNQGLGLYEAPLGLAIAKQSLANKYTPPSEDLLNESIVYFEKSSLLNSKKSDIFGRWGVSYLILAREKSGKEAKTLVRRARKVFRIADRISPRTPSIIINIGNSLWHEASISGKNNKDKLRDEAERYYLEAESLLHGSAAYNLSCCYGSRSDADKSTYWLLIAFARGTRPVTRMSIERDSDFDTVRDSVPFKQALLRMFGDS